MPQISYAELGRPIQRQIDALKPELNRFAQRFAVVQESRAELAPRFMRLFNQIAGDHDNFTFVEFVRLFDATVPTQAAGDDGYRTHKTYMAADYLRRLTRQRPRGRQGVRDSATDALARTIATVMQAVRDPLPMWSAIQAEFGFTERAMTGLKRRVEATKPLFELVVPRPVPVGTVIHMQRQAAPAEAEAAPARRRAAA